MSSIDNNKIVIYVRKKELIDMNELKKPFNGKIIYKTKTGKTRSRTIKLPKLQLCTNEICTVIDDEIMQRLN